MLTYQNVRQLIGAGPYGGASELHSGRLRGGYSVLIGELPNRAKSREDGGPEKEDGMVRRRPFRVWARCPRRGVDVKTVATVNDAPAE